MAMIGLRLSLWYNSATGGTVSPSIQLSGDWTVAENLAVNGDVGTLSVVNGSGSYTFSITADPDNKFALNGDGVTLEVDQALDYETKTSHSVTISADNGVDTPIERTFTITVTNVLEVTLAALTLSADDIISGSSPGTVVGAIQNKSSGSTLSMVDDAGGRFAIDGSNNLIAGLVATDFGTATSHNITIRETHADGSNSPRNTGFTINVLDDSVQILLDNNSIAEDAINTDVVGTASVSGGSGSPTFSLVDDAGGTFAIDSGTGVITVLDNTDLATNASFSVTIGVTNVTPDPDDLVVTIWVIANAPTLDMIASSDSGSDDTDNITAETQPTFNFGGTLYDTTDTVKFYDSLVEISSHVVTSGEISTGEVSLGETLSEGVHSITATITRGGFESDQSGALSITIDTTAPTITTGSTANVNENATLSVSLTANETVTWSITGGADSAKFEISGTTLRWTANGTKNFEAPDDADTNNTYVVQVTATDVAGNATNKTITVTVDDVAEGGGASAFLLEDGTSFFLLEDGTSKILLEA